MGKGLFAIAALLMLAGVAAQADNVAFTDNFTGVNGTSVIGSSWGYQDDGVELSDWAVHPRTAPADIFQIQNNSLYAKITPLEIPTTTDYDKVMASIYPMVGGSQVSLGLGAGQKAVYSVDLLNASANDGAKWGMNQQIKLVLTDGVNNFMDPNSSSANSFVFCLTVRRSSDTNALTYQGLTFTGGTQASTTTQTITRPAAGYPYKMQMSVDNTGLASFYFNDTTTPFATLQGVAMTNLHPYLWCGKFNGDGTQPADGDVTLDNYSVGVVNITKPPPPQYKGDFNNDGAVDDGDYTVWADAFGKNPQAEHPTWQAGTGPGGTYSDAEYTTWADYFGKTVAITPEPVSMSIFALGSLGLLIRRRSLLR